jgi:hypothetical protein
MEGTTMTQFKWFWPWQDEGEEAWLGKMSREGKHLESVSIPAFYTFKLGSSRDYVYRLDYWTKGEKDKLDYLLVFQDAGWEYIGELSNWQYFRKEAGPREETEIFSDVQSKIEKYRRLLAYLGFFLIFLVVIFLDIVISQHPYAWWGGVQFIYMVMVAVYIFSVVKIMLRIRQLRRF